MRAIIFDVLDRGDDNNSCIQITREEVIEIIKRLQNDLHYFDFLDDAWGGCIWEWNTFRRFQKRNIKNLKKLEDMMRRHPEMEVYFYDSY